MMGPRNECFGCGHAGHDATLSICSVIWMGERCGCGGCAEDEHEWETDYPSRECMKCGLVEDSPDARMQIPHATGGRMTDTFPIPIDDGICAVEGCTAWGRPQLCPYDRKYHRHGYIHYENGHPAHPTMVFRRGAWHWICDRDYEAVVGALRAHASAK